MTLADLCEPIFLHLTRLNRLVRKGGAPDEGAVWHELTSLFVEAREKAAGLPGLGAQFSRVEVPLLLFADETVRQTGLPWAANWPGLASQHPTNPDESVFFDLLDETIDDRTDAASERLGIYYTCLGLGFRGDRAAQPQYLKRKMQEIRPRLRESGAVDSARLTPEAYDHLRAGREIDVVVGDYVGMISLVLVVLVAALFAFIGLGYRQAGRGLASSLDAIESVHSSVFGEPPAAEASP